MLRLSFSKAAALVSLICLSINGHYLTIPAEHTIGLVNIKCTVPSMSLDEYCAQMQKITEKKFDYIDQVEKNGLEYAFKNANKTILETPKYIVTTLNPLDLFVQELKNGAQTQELLSNSLHNNTGLIAFAKAAQVQNSWCGKAICAYRSARENVASLIKSAPQAIVNFCKQNPKKVGVAAAVTVAALGTAAYLYAKGYFSTKGQNLELNAKRYFSKTKTKPAKAK